MKQRFFIALLFIGVVCFAKAQVWQWSVKVDSVLSNETNDHPQAFLWIPEHCRAVRGVLFAQHNMVEEGMLEHPFFRNVMSELGFAEVWVTPGIHMPFDFTKDAGEDFIHMMKQLAVVSGYGELASAPVVPIGHSAYATFPWNFAAWNPGRTLALISVHGDAPQTPLTGYGRANVEWGNKNIDGVPGLFIMGEFEWWEDRIIPGFDYVRKHPNSPVSFFADAGHGHFDYSDEMIAYVCMFIKKAAQARLPKTIALNKPFVLREVKPEQGWLMDRWRKDSLPLYTAAPYKDYSGNRYYSSWCFDKEMADATEKFYANARGKIEQHIGFRQNGEPLQPTKSHANFNLPFSPLSDGISFTLSAFFADTSSVKPVGDFARTPLIIKRICGPVKKINDTTFQLSFYRMGFNNPRRSNDIWLLASNKGDEKYKSAVQQLNIRFPLQNKEGIEQSLTFPKIADREVGEKVLALTAVSDSHLPVSYYVKEGPAFANGNRLYFTQIPPRTKYPVKVTVVAWQYGVAGKIQTATPVERSFYLTKK